MPYGNPVGRYPHGAPAPDPARYPVPGTRVLQCKDCGFLLYPVCTVCMYV
jgi:hypothetical protein